MAYHTSKISTPMDDEVRRGQKNSKTVRYGAALPLAAVMTMGLTLSMAGLIKAEFIPQDKTETANYEINPRVEDIPDPIRKEKPDQLKTVETPPPPPTVATYKTAAVELPFREMKGAKTIFEPTDIFFGDLTKGIKIEKTVAG